MIPHDEHGTPRCPKCDAEQVYVSVEVNYAGVPFELDEDSGPQFDPTQGNAIDSSVYRVFCTACGWETYDEDEIYCLLYKEAWA
jgi:hypothetical protein